ncbi:hypothetical protein [Olleya marilimosa]|uniref:hypothetical protein n=1 Tax=Olleya marilimosa TaxID=272164 RepID=UPI0030EC614E|tara:strand:- start:79274 stop:79732 length:459 start_codon:yes stop_codon:yes gene_type:complete
MDNDQNKIIKEEIDAVIADIITAYEQSGKRTSGEFANGLEAIYEPNKATIKGYVYLAGRTAGKMPPVESIERWIKQKGITPIEQGMTTTSLAWAIAKSIAKKGTNKENHLKIYEQVITPERIDSIIKKVSSFNVNLFITEMTTQLQLIQKNV